MTFDLQWEEFRPFIKPNNKPKYVHAKSNHPPSIIKNIPSSIQKRLSVNSSSEHIFDQAKAIYQEALNECGYDFQLKFEQEVHEDVSQKKKRRRKITYFNPPFSKSVATNIGKYFFKLLDESFPREHKLRNILNRNTIKLSYRCTKNLQSSVSSHNAKIYKQNFPAAEPSDCNCGERPCVLPEGCSAKNIVYQATVTQNDGQIETYVGLPSTPFWQRYANHKNPLQSSNIVMKPLLVHLYGS